MSTSSLWLETLRGYVAVDHVAVIEYEKSGGGYAVVVRLAVIAGDAERGVDPETRRVAYFKEEPDAEGLVGPLVWEIAHRRARGESGILSISGTEIEFENAAVRVGDDEAAAADS
jgi:hypothetical protein